MSWVEEIKGRMIVLELSWSRRDASHGNEVTRRREEEERHTPSWQWKERSCLREERREERRLRCARLGDIEQTEGEKFVMTLYTYF